MDFSQYTESSTAIKEYMLEVSDGVSLKIIDFTPENISSDKPVIIFAAGWISLISGWKGVLKVLTSKYRVLYFESREKLSSKVPDVKKVSFSMERLQLDIGEIIEQVIRHEEKFILAGSSLGASAILEYCGSDGKKPSAAVLIAPNAEFRFPRILGSIIPVIHPRLYFMIKPVIKWYLKNIRLDKKNSLEQIEKYCTTLDCADPYKLKANALAIKNYSFWNRKNSINVPCLIIGATSDTLHGTDKIKNIIKMIPDSKYIELGSNMDTHSEKAGYAIEEYLQKIQHAAP